MDDSARAELIGVANEWDRAMVENDAEAIGRYMADDWTIVGSDGSVGDKPTFLIKKWIHEANEDYEATHG